MSQVEFYDEVVGLASFVIEGENYSEDGESAVVPVAVLKRTDIASIHIILILKSVNHNLMR